MTSSISPSSSSSSTPHGLPMLPIRPASASPSLAGGTGLAHRVPRPTPLATPVPFNSSDIPREFFVFDDKGHEIDFVASPTARLKQIGDDLLIPGFSKKNAHQIKKDSPRGDASVSPEFSKIIAFQIKKDSPKRPNTAPDELK